MSSSTDIPRQSAVREFHAARWGANLELIRAALTGKSADLLSYEDVRTSVHARETSRRQLKEIPLDAIVGSVGRSRDFTRRFLPLVDEDQLRWARVHSLTGSMTGLPPIEVYQIGEVYFVRDGNHRVSVARSQDQPLIEAYVTLVETDVPLDPTVQPDDLIIKERYVEFLERTRLQEAHPDLDLSMSLAGNYRVLEKQIGVHQWWVKEYKGEEITYPEAAERWYRYIYSPVVQMIRERGMMRDFPERTEADLYVWIDEHRQQLAEELEWAVDAEMAASDLAGAESHHPKQIIRRIGSQVNRALTENGLAAKPEPGLWRESSLLKRRMKRLFPRLLVAMNGQNDGWLALDQAVKVAQLERGHLYGLHVVAQLDEKNSREIAALKARFSERCRQAGVPGEMCIETGAVTPTICDRARWTDLVVVSLAHPPGPQAFDRLNSNFRKLLSGSPRPVLAVPHTVTEFRRILLAYDGSPKANEALFIALYMAGQWQLPLILLTVVDDPDETTTSDKARAKLEGHDLQVTYLQRTGDPAQAVLSAAEAEEIDLIILGGYGQIPLVEVVVGSVVDQVLRKADRPLLICR